MIQQTCARDLTWVHLYWSWISHKNLSTTQAWIQFHIKLFCGIWYVVYNTVCLFFTECFKSISEDDNGTIHWELKQNTLEFKKMYFNFSYCVDINNPNVSFSFSYLHKFTQALSSSVLLLMYIL